MRRVVVYRDGNQLAAQIGPDWVQGIAGSGDTVADARRSTRSHLFCQEAPASFEARGPRASHTSIFADDVALGVGITTGVDAGSSGPEYSPCLVPRYAFLFQSHIESPPMLLQSLIDTP